MATFPGGIWAGNGSLTDLVDFWTAARANDLNDEQIAAQTGLIWAAHGAPTDNYMDADPGFDQVLNSGDSYVTYSAVNDRIEAALVGDAGSTVRSIYKVLPTPLQITPEPTAIIEMLIDFTIQSVSGTGDMFLWAGLMDGTVTETEAREFFGIEMFLSGGAIDTVSATIAGATSLKQTSFSAISTATRYQARMGWQADRPISMSSALYNYATGATVDAEAFNAVTLSAQKDSELPHIGVKFWGDNAGDSASVYIHDMYARIIRP